MKINYLLRKEIAEKLLISIIKEKLKEIFLIAAASVNC